MEIGHIFSTAAIDLGGIYQSRMWFRSVTET